MISKYREGRVWYVPADQDVRREHTPGLEVFQCVVEQVRKKICSSAQNDRWTRLGQRPGRRDLGPWGFGGLVRPPGRSNDTIRFNSLVSIRLRPGSLSRPSFHSVRLRDGGYQAVHLWRSMDLMKAVERFAKNPSGQLFVGAFDI